MQSNVIEPPVSGVTVYFRVFDVDDPFDQLRGPNAADPADALPGVEMLDGDAAGPDNRGGVEGDYLAQDVTNSQGRAEITITVSMQPGNNYRASASLLSEALWQNTTRDGQTLTPRQLADWLSVATDPQGKFIPNGGAAYSAPAHWSPMLTVWRKLTLEVDSMGQESQLPGDRGVQSGFEMDECVPSAISVNMPSPGLSTLHCDPLPDHLPGFAGTNAYEGGAFTCDGHSDVWMVVRSDLAFDLILYGLLPSTAVGARCLIRDDDPYFTPNTAPRQLPKTSLLQAEIPCAYDQAYIDIVEASVISNPRILVPWSSHLSALTLTNDYRLAIGTSSMWDLGSQNSYWVRHVVACYQPGSSEDADGDVHENCANSNNSSNCSIPVYSLLGLPGLPIQPEAYGYTIREELYWDTGRSTIYVEAIRDQQFDPTSARLWQFVAHEVGHKVVLMNGQVTGGEHSEGGLMSGEPQTGPLQNIPSHWHFTAPTLLRFRETQRW